MFNNNIVLISLQKLPSIMSQIHPSSSSTFNCGNCHSLIRNEDFDSSFLSLSKLQLDSITHHHNKTSNHLFSDSKNISSFTQDFQSSNAYKKRISKHNHKPKLKDSIYILLNENDKSNQTLPEVTDSVLLTTSDDHTISRKIKALEPVFEILNDSLVNLDSLNGDLLPNIKHPLCKECCTILKTKLNEKFNHLLIEKEKYQNFLKKLQIYKNKVLENSNRGNDTQESIKSFSYSLSPKKKNNDRRLSMQSFENKSPVKSLKNVDFQSGLSKADISNMQEIKRINKETDELIDKIKEAKLENERLDLTLAKEKLLQKKKKKTFLVNANVRNTQKYLQYQHNFEKWNNLSMDIERVHEDLAKLRNLNIYNTVFNISTVEVDKHSSALDASFDTKKLSNGFNNFGSINELKLGCSWRETNAALGQVILCLSNLSIPISTTQTASRIDSNIEWFPLGSVSRLIKQGIEYNIFYDPSDNSIKKEKKVDNSIHNADNGNNWNFLFFKNNSNVDERKEIKVNKLKNFNEAMVIILQYINTLLGYYNEMKVKLLNKPDTVKITAWSLPYRIEDDKINNLSIKYTGSDVEWALSCKFLLINLKYLMIYRHKLYQLESEAA